MMNFGSDRKKPWKDIWGCGQGIAAVTEVMPAGALVDRLRHEYVAALRRLGETALAA
jgi:nitronate monooxygenase